MMENEQISNEIIETNIYVINNGGHTYQETKLPL